MEEILKLQEMAEFLQCHPLTLTRLANTGKIPSFKVGSNWRFNLEEIKKWIKKEEAKLFLSYLSGKETQSHKENAC